MQQNGICLSFGMPERTQTGPRQPSARSAQDEIAVG